MKRYKLIKNRGYGDPYEQNAIYDADFKTKGGNCTVIQLVRAHPEDWELVMDHFKVGDWVTIIQNNVDHYGDVFRIEEGNIIRDGNPDYQITYKGCKWSFDFNQIRLATQDEIEIVTTPKSATNFKVGDWITITKSDENWASEMDEYDGRVMQLTEDYSNPEGSNSFRIGRWGFVHYQGHFRHSTIYEIDVARCDVSTPYPAEMAIPHQTTELNYTQLIAGIGEVARKANPVLLNRRKKVGTLGFSTSKTSKLLINNKS